MKILEALISNGELYGLQMVEVIPGLKRGTVYVTLGRMESKSYISSREEKDPRWGGLPRRLYRVTGLGQQVLRATQEGAAAAARVMGGGFANA